MRVRGCAEEDQMTRTWSQFASILIFSLGVAAAASMASDAHAKPKHGAEPNRAAAEQRSEPVRSSPGGASRFAPADNGETVHDNILHVTWLRDANFPAKQKYHLPVNDNGSMDYATAQKWVRALNSDNHGLGYLGHKNWTLPTTPSKDASCSTIGPKPQRDHFGYGCRNSSLGSLYYDGFGLAAPNTAVAMPPGQSGPFKNFQPYLYWSATAAGKNKNGYSTFSFNTGWQGQNVSQHAMYVLPMIRGNPFGAPNSKSKKLQPVAGGEAVYDPVTDVTWLADANLARRETFNVSGVNKDGSMAQSTSTPFTQAMSAYQGKGYLGQRHWEAPPATLTQGAKPCGNFNCKDSPMGELFYNQFGLRAGQSVVAAPDIPVGQFHDIQPYLYWSCGGGDATRSQICTGLPAANFAWSFSFGNGFEGTDLQVNDLYVTAYYPDAAAGPPQPGPLPRPKPGKCATPMQCCIQSGGYWTGRQCT
jgi:hypothetical protein